MKMHRIARDFTLPFTFGTVEARISQSAPRGLDDSVYEQYKTEVDGMASEFVAAVYKAMADLTATIRAQGYGKGAESHTHGAWLDIEQWHVSVRLNIDLTRTTPRFVVAGVVDPILIAFRELVSGVMDPSFKAYLAEGESKHALENLIIGLGLHAAMPDFASLIGNIRSGGSSPYGAAPRPGF